MSSEFVVWGLKNAFSCHQYPCLTCIYCQQEVRDCHMCAFNSENAELIKLQPCVGINRYYDHISQKEVCNRCFISCVPQKDFKKNVQSNIDILRQKLLSMLDDKFVDYFITSVYDFLVKDCVLICVPCSLSLEDYSWGSYSHMMRSHRLCQVR